MLEKELKKKLEGVPVKETYTSKRFGNVVVYNDPEKLGNTDQNYYSVEFLNTGYITKSTITAIHTDGINDRLYKNIFNVACLGYAKPADDEEAHTSWRAVIKKCYNPNDRYYKNYGAKGYFVCKRWLRFDLFLEDYKRYNRSKEYKTKFVIKPGKKEFCFENCEFVPIVKQKDSDKVYHTLNHGDYKIIGRERDKNGTLKYRIKFLLTGYETLINSSKIKTMDIRDPYYPTVYGLGYRGEGEYDGNEKYYKREYALWRGMFDRCCNQKHHSYKSYGGAGITIHPDWYNFNRFLHDIKQLENYQEWKDSPGKYSFDKDSLQLHLPRSQKIYSKDTCKFILAIENTKYRCEEALQRNNKDYYGVYKTKYDTYAAEIHCKEGRKYLGTYDSAEAAANARDWWANFYGNPILNSDLDLPYMSPEEWVFHRRLANNEEHKQLYKLKPRQLYHLINKEDNEDDNEG